jgi:hypothetical protein
MIDTLMNLLFRCSHRQLSSPVSRRVGSRVSPYRTYVVCLECGKQFAYDLQRCKPLKTGRRAWEKEKGTA